MCTFYTLKLFIEIPCTFWLDGDYCSNIDVQWSHSIHSGGKSGKRKYTIFAAKGKGMLDGFLVNIFSAKLLWEQTWDQTGCLARHILRSSKVHQSPDCTKISSFPIFIGSGMQSFIAALASWLIFAKLSPVLCSFTLGKPPNWEDDGWGAWEETEAPEPVSLAIAFHY